MYNPLDLSDKLILVTGASSGIGRATAITLSRLGADVIITGRRTAALEATLGQMDRQSSHFVDSFDLSNVDEIPGWLKRLTGQIGRALNGLVHAAGVAKYTPIRAITRRSMDEIIVPNLYASLALLRGCTARGVGAEGGSMVLLSSVSSQSGEPGLVTYSASKGALNAVVRSAALELREKRVRVNCVAPGYVKTPMLDQVRDGLPGTFDRNSGRQFLGLANPEEIAVAIAYLLSDAARLVTGTTLMIDGGYTC